MGTAVITGPVSIGGLQHTVEFHRLLDGLLGSGQLGEYVRECMGGGSGEVLPDHLGAEYDIPAVGVLGRIEPWCSAGTRHFLHQGLLLVR